MKQFDPSLILPWQEELDLPYSFPCAAYYNQDGHALCFIAARHDYNVASATHQLIDREWETFNPQAVIVEGYTNSVDPAWDDDLRDYFVKRSLAKVAANPSKQNEARYTLLKAHSANLAIYSGEPSQAAQIDTVVTHGYTVADYTGATFFMRLTATKDNFVMTSENLPDLWASLSPQIDMEFSEFNKWYKRFTGKYFCIDQIEAGSYQPDHTQPFGTFDHIDSVISMTRDHQLLKVIETALNDHQRVMVVYGGSHYSCQRPALDKTLGQPVFVH